MVTMMVNKKICIFLLVNKSKIKVKNYTERVKM